MKKIACLLLVMALAVCVFVMPASAETPEYLYGDADKNGKIEANDALTILKYVVGKIPMADGQDCMWDVDKDFAVTAADALDVLKYVVGKIDVFKAGDGIVQFSMAGQIYYTMDANDKQEFCYTVECALEDYSVSYSYDSKYVGMISLEWGPWDGNDILLHVTTHQVSQPVTIPIRVFITEQPSSYLVFRLTVLPVS